MSTLPSKLPDVLGFDIEIYDPDIKKRYAFKTGYVLGVALATSASSWYIPLQHTDTENVNQDDFKRWLKTLENKTLIGANIQYDLEFLVYHYDFKLNGTYYDIQLAEPILDEHRKSYSLDSLAQKYLQATKQDAALVEWSEKEFGKRVNPYSMIYRAPYSIVSEYALVDAALPPKIFESQKTILSSEDSWGAFMQETELIPLMIAMRMKGVHVDTRKAYAAIERLDEETQQLQATLNALSPEADINVYAARSIGAACRSLDISYPLTEKTKAPSFTQGWMSKQEHQLFKLILAIRHNEKLVSTFLRGSILNYANDATIATRFHQLRSDNHGAISGRFSSSNPNLQFIPSDSRSATGKFVREIFIPLPSHTWYKFDYSSIEPRIALHYANLLVKDEQVRDMTNYLISNPAEDIYAPMMQVLPDFTRGVVKSIYLGIGYGMGIKKLATQLNVGEPDAKRYRQTFYTQVPYVLGLSQFINRTAARRGWIKTLIGRRRRFDLWQSREDYFSKALPKDEAARTYGPLSRAFTYKAFNAVIQGSAADVMKQAMLKLFKAGLPIPHLTVHDELDFSLPIGDTELAQEIKHTMEQAWPLTVPMHVTVESGPSWGELK